MEETTTIGRRRVLGLLAAGAAVGLAAACGSGDGATTAATAGTAGTSSSGTSDGTTGSTSGSGSGATAATTASDEAIPEETAGPYPADGSNGPNVLDDDGIVRRDIRSSFGASTTTIDGIPLEIELVCPGAAVYLWHCDRDGNYSVYGSVEDENWLRGVQAAGDDGIVRFTSIFPGCYDGRWPHIHFEVYGSVEDAVGSGPILATSQLAFPDDTCAEAYATAGYESSASNLGRVSLDSDMVFRDDGAARQLATMTGSPTAGYTARLEVPV